MSMDHSLDRPDERARITRMKGQVLKTREVERVLPDPQEVPRDLVMQRNIALGASCVTVEAEKNKREMGGEGPGRLGLCGVLIVYGSDVSFPGASSVVTVRRY